VKFGQNLCLTFLNCRGKTCEAVRAGKKLEVINNTGTLIISFIYDDASDFSEGLTRVRIRRNWGFIDKNGKEVVKNVSPETIIETNVSQTSATSPEQLTTANNSAFNRPGQVSIGFSPLIYVEPGYFYVRTLWKNEGWYCQAYSFGRLVFI